MEKENDTKTSSEHSHSVPYDTQPAGFEKKIDEIVHTNSPVQLPENVRTWIADNVWWLTLVGGVLSLLAAWNFWQAAHLISVYTQMAALYGGYTADLGVTWYLALVGMVAQAAILLMAFQKLKEKKKSGWNLLYYSSLVSLVIGVVYIFVPNYASGLMGMLLGTLVGWFFLFQIREKFTK